MGCKSKYIEAIAEFCGWERELHTSPTGVERMRWITPEGCESAQGALPRYFDDLNAMHKAEQSLKFSERMEYAKQLAFVMTPEVMRDTVRVSEIYRASAEQRAEAFLRTIGKWEEEDA